MSCVLLEWCWYEFSLVLRLYNCLRISPCCAILYEFHYIVQFFVNFTILCNFWWFHHAMFFFYEFYHVVLLFVNFTVLLMELCLCRSSLCYCYTIFCEFYHVVQFFKNFFSYCSTIFYEFHHVVQLFVNFTMLCNSLWTSLYCTIICKLNHVVQLFVISNWQMDRQLDGLMDGQTARWKEWVMDKVKLWDPSDLNRVS